MIECIFTLDYEIFGNGEGSLKELIYDPAERLLEIFRKWGCRSVVFVEVAELEVIEAQGSDTAIELIKHQVREFYRQGHEIALHLHPQWYNAAYTNGKWHLDYTEYNLCTLPQERIEHIIDRSLAYMRTILDEPDFMPVSFRAGNWLFQPTKNAADVLAGKGIKVDSSVFKGGLQRFHGLDYRPALKNGPYWPFRSDVNRLDPEGSLLEIPIHTVMVPFWNMLTSKRVGIQRKVQSTSQGNGRGWDRIPDFLRLRYPLKFDFCRMTMNELTSIIDNAIKQDERRSAVYSPLVAIGHTKDLVDTETIDSFLSYLRDKSIAVTTLEDAFLKCKD